MSDMTNAFEDEIYEALRTDTPHLALFSVAPSESSAGTEVSGNGYTRMPVTLAAGGGTGAGANTAQVDFPVATGGGWTVVAVGILDASSGGTLKFYKAVSLPASGVIAAGQSIRVAVGALTVAFA